MAMGTTQFTYHYYRFQVGTWLVKLVLWVALTRQPIILLPDPSLANSIHVQRRPTYALFLSDHDGWSSRHCLCTKIQPVSNTHTRHTAHNTAHIHTHHTYTHKYMHNTAHVRAHLVALESALNFPAPISIPASARNQTALQNRILKYGR